MPKQWIAGRAEMEAILHECAVGSLATINSDGTPYIVTVNHIYLDGKIYFHCALKGQKMENIAREPRVCFKTHVMERIVRAPRAVNFSVRYRSVIVQGRARQITGEALKRDVLMALTTRHAEGNPFEPPSEKSIAGTAVVEIEIEKMTGKRNIDN